MREFLIFAGKRSHDGKKIYGQIVLVGDEYVILPFHVFERDGHHVGYESTDAPAFFEQNSFEVAKIASDTFTNLAVSHTHDFNEDSEVISRETNSLNLVRWILDLCLRSD